MSACRYVTYCVGLVFLVGCGSGRVAKTRDASISSPLPEMSDGRVANATHVISSGPAWTANIGVVVDSPVSYNPDRLFADAIKSAREFASYGDLNTPVGLDSDGWPKEDASILVWEGAAGSYLNGRYRFSCDGRVTGNNVTALGASFGNWRYDRATRRSTADLQVSENGNLALFFKGIPGGVKHVKLIRPGLLDTDDFNPDYLQTPDALQLAAHLGLRSHQQQSDRDMVAANAPQLRDARRSHAAAPLFRFQ